nr:MAG TPA: hypothetical protein [Bacteriophage sp.]
MQFSIEVFFNVYKLIPHKSLREVYENFSCRLQIRVDIVDSRCYYAIVHITFYIKKEEQYGRIIYKS